MGTFNSVISRSHTCSEKMRSFIDDSECDLENVREEKAERGLKYSACNEEGLFASRRNYGNV